MMHFNFNHIDSKKPSSKKSSFFVLKSILIIALPFLFLIILLFGYITISILTSEEYIKLMDFRDLIYGKNGIKLKEIRFGTHMELIINNSNDINDLNDFIKNPVEKPWFDGDKIFGIIVLSNEKEIKCYFGCIESETNMELAIYPYEFDIGGVYIIKLHGRVSELIQHFFIDQFRKQKVSLDFQFAF